MATLTKMSVINTYCWSSEGCVLLGREGGMTRDERVDDNEIDVAGQGREEGGMVRDNANKDE